jgi:hypothetical protein
MGDAGSVRYLSRDGVERPRRHLTGDSDMLFRTVAGVFALALFTGPLAAEDKKDKDKPAATTWTRESNGVDLKFEIGKDTLKGTVLSGENGFIATCKITMDKEGLVKATITEVEEKGNFPNKPKVGLEFSFKWKVDGDKAELSDLKGDGVEDAKSIVEGEYKKKK